MNQLQVIGLGMATLDIIVRAGSLAQGGPIDGLVIDGGGMACNAVVAAQKLGVISGFVGTFGSDRLGQLKLPALRESGVDTSRIVLRQGPDDQVVLVHIQSENGERSFHPLAAPGRRLLVPDELDHDYLTQAAYLLVDGFHPRASLQAATWMRAAGRQVMLDANVTHGPPSPEIRELLRLSHILICSAGFCQALTATDDLPQAARQVLELGPRIVVQTGGARGSDTFTAEESFHTPAFTVPVIDTSGAGDVFHGAYLAGLLHSWDLHRTAVFASAAAALKCMKLGREGYPTLAEIQQLLKE